MTKIIFTITILLSSFLGSFYYTHPQYEAWQAKLLENETLELELESINNYIAELDRVEKDIEDNIELLERVGTAFPEDHDIASLFLYLEDVIKRNNLETQSSFGAFSEAEYRPDGTAHPRIKETKVALTVEGRYADIRGFLKDLENLIRIIRVDSFNIEGKDNQAGRRVISIQFDVNAYSY